MASARNRYVARPVRRAMFLLALAAAIFRAGPTVAVDAQAGPASMDALAAGRGPIAAPAEMQLADDLNGECASILAQVPKLSPVERAWLQGELAAATDAGAVRARPEYARNELFAFFEACEIETAQIFPQAGVRERTAAWARLVSRLVGEGGQLDDWAGRSGLESIRAPVHRFSGWANRIPRDILERVIVPYLERESP
jgi:hypothetical protein